MRTTDDLNPEPPFRPLGEKVEKPPAPPKPWAEPRGDYGIVEENGRLRTTRDPQTQVRIQAIVHGALRPLW